MFIGCESECEKPFMTQKDCQGENTHNLSALNICQKIFTTGIYQEPDTILLNNSPEHPCNLVNELIRGKYCTRYMTQMYLIVLK